MRTCRQAPSALAWGTGIAEGLRGELTRSDPREKVGKCIDEQPGCNPFNYPHLSYYSLSLWERVGVRATAMEGARPWISTAANPHPSPLPEGEGAIPHGAGDVSNRKGATRDRP